MPIRGRSPRGSDRRAAHPSGMMDRLRRWLSAVGAALTGTGVLILLFVAYQLWGTGLYTARAQSDLKASFRAKVAAPPPSPSTTSTTAITAPPPPPPSGDAVAMVRIPKIGVDRAVVEGVSPADLRKGPGHYPATPMPGERGNAAIAGHRTTYGAPFNRLDELQNGDEIDVTTLTGNYTYRVIEQKIVRPDQVEVLDPTPDARLTLTTCHPKYSAKQRLVVVATLAPDQAPLPPPPAASQPSGPAPELAVFGEAGLSSEQSRLPTIGWGMATAATGGLWAWAVRRRRQWSTYVLGAVPFLVALFFFYANLELLLPANF